MAYADKLTGRAALFDGSANVFLGRYICLQVILLLSLVLARAANTSGQDVAALARQDQARKNAQPNHQSHLYTNDDMVRPQILTANDDVEFGNARESWKPSLFDVPPLNG